MQLFFIGNGQKYQSIFLCITLACAVLKLVESQRIFSISSHLQKRNQIKWCIVTFFVFLQHKLINSNFVSFYENETILKK